MMLRLVRALGGLSAAVLLTSCDELGERASVVRTGFEPAPVVDARPAVCEPDRPGGCAGAWCESVAASVARDPCVVFEALAAASCQSGVHVERCVDANDLRLVELAAEVGEELVPLAKNRVRCGRMRVVPSSCSPGFRVTYVFRSLPDGQLAVESRLDSVQLGPDGAPSFSTVFCGACLQIGRLDGGWEPRSLTRDELQQLLARQAREEAVARWSCETPPTDGGVHISRGRSAARYQCEPGAAPVLQGVHDADCYVDGAHELRVSGAVEDGGAFWVDDYLVDSRRAGGRAWQIGKDLLLPKAFARSAASHTEPAVAVFVLSLSAAADVGAVRRPMAGKRC